VEIAISIFRRPVSLTQAVIAAGESRMSVFRRASSGVTIFTMPCGEQSSVMFAVPGLRISSRTESS